MGLWMSWTLAGVGTAGATVDDVEAAVRALEASVERSRLAFDSAGDWERLRGSANLVRAGMLNEGREAVERGQAWRLALGGVHVYLAPSK